MLGVAAELIRHCRPAGGNPFHPSLGPLAAILPLVVRRVQLSIPLGSNVLLMPGEHVLRRHATDRAAQPEVVVSVPILLNQAFCILQRQRRPRSHTVLSASIGTLLAAGLVLHAAPRRVLRYPNGRRLSPFPAEAGQRHAIVLLAIETPRNAGKRLISLALTHIGHSPQRLKSE
jgi:hypothetical protein